MRVSSDIVSRRRLLFLTALSVVFFATTGFQSYALPQSETQSGSQESTLFDNTFRQLRDGWQHRTVAEQKKAAAILIAEADKLPDSDPQKARALLMASGLYIDDIPREIALVKRVIAIDGKNFGGDDPQVASDLRNLAFLSALTGDVIEAERSYGRAVEIAERAEQMSSFDRTMVFAGAADFHKQQKRYEEAERLLRRAVEVAAGLPTAQTSLRLQLRANLAALLRYEGKEDEAERLLAEPPPASKTARASSGLTDAENDSLRARQYQEQGNLREAEVFYQHAISAFERAPDAGFLLARDLDQLADIYHSEKRDVEAEELFRRALSIRERSLSPETALNARVMALPFALQNFLRDQGRLREIEPVYQQTLTIQEQYLGPNDYSLSQTLQMLASVYREEGKSEAALPLCQRALKIAERDLGENDPRVAAILNEYARNLQELGRMGEASAIRTRAERIPNRKPSPK
jgi:tetratricopeptide (TPR) repeat protein